MTWPFCSQCGSILEPPVGTHVTCNICNFSCPFHQINTGEVITLSAIRSKPTWVNDDEEKIGGDTSRHAVINEPCPKCAHPELYFYTMQLRSVDEGSTVFYECPKCNHKWSQNN